MPDLSLAEIEEEKNDLSMQIENGNGAAIAQIENFEMRPLHDVPLLKLDPMCGEQETRFLSQHNILQQLLEARAKFLSKAKTRVSNIENSHFDILQQAAANTMIVKTDEALKCPPPQETLPKRRHVFNSNPNTVQSTSEGKPNRPHVSNDCHSSKKR